MTWAYSSKKANQHIPDTQGLEIPTPIKCILPFVTTLFFISQVFSPSKQYDTT